MKMLNQIISKIKGEEFAIDKRIPIVYLVRFLCVKFFSLLYGTIRLWSIKSYYVHPTATIKCRSLIKVGKNLNIAQGCYIDALSKKGLVAGYNLSIGYQTHIELTGSLRFLGEGMIIGNNVGLGTHGHYGSGKGLLIIGDNTIFGNYVSIHPESHIFSDLEIPIRMQGVEGTGVVIGQNCWIGAKVTILDGSKIGDGCIIAAGSVVKGSFPNNVIIGGIPAKILKYRTNIL